VITLDGDTHQKKIIGIKKEINMDPLRRERRGSKARKEGRKEGSRQGRKGRQQARTERKQGRKMLYR